jgi:4-hydroxy-tetrahydrodipicolinate synthase
MNLNDYPLYTALVTPLYDNGEIDFDSFFKLMREQEAAKVGILILGSTGESLNLSEEERKEVVTRVSKEKFKVPLMVGVGGVHLPSTLEWIDFLNGFSFISSYLLVTPLYAKPGDVGQREWFKALLDRADKPCVLYNVPGRTGVAMSVKAVSELNSHPKFWGIKEASGSVEKFTQYKKATKGQLMFCGDDALMPDFAKAGAFGLISVASNPWPAATLLYVNKSVGNSLTENEIAMWKECSNSLFIASNPVPAKRLMFEKKQIATPVLKEPLSHEDLHNVEILLASDKKISAWFKG